MFSISTILSQEIAKTTAFKKQRVQCFEVMPTSKHVGTVGQDSHLALIIGLVLGAILLLILCCLCAWLIARARRRNYKDLGSSKSDEPEMECDLDCPGEQKPLVNDKKSKK